MKRRFAIHDSHFALLFLTALVVTGGACSPTSPGEPQPETPVQQEVAVRSFQDELAFLRAQGPVELLESPAGGRVALSARYQGRVMTSAVTESGPGLGWVNRSFIESGRTGTQFDNYGGEDRFWIGPEGGQYGFYFPPGGSFVFDQWQVPATLHEGTWEIREQSAESVTYVRSMTLTNYSAAEFQLTVERTVRLLSEAQVRELAGDTIPDGVQWVGFETVNQVTNAGPRVWEKETGLLSIWIPGMFNPFDTTTVAIPFRDGAGEGVVNDRYFGEVPADRLEVREGYLLFRCDGKFRSKIGIGPRHVQPLLGSYTPSVDLLTLVQFNFPEGAGDYVNSMWELQQQPYAGDVINSYNDGPPEPGKPALGGFYELETSSPALALAPGESYTHIHRTLHLVGPRQALDGIAEATLGVTATAMTEAF